MEQAFGRVLIAPHVRQRDHPIIVGCQILRGNDQIPIIRIGQSDARLGPSRQQGLCCEIDVDQMSESPIVARQDLGSIGFGKVENVSKMTQVAWAKSVSESSVNVDSRDLLMYPEGCNEREIIFHPNVAADSPFLNKLTRALEVLTACVKSPHQIQQSASGSGSLCGKFITSSPEC